MPEQQLRDRLERLTRQFIDGVFEALRTVPLQELAEEISSRRANPLREAPARSSATRSRGRSQPATGARSSAPGAKSLTRRSAVEIQRVRDGILAFLKRSPTPAGATEIARSLDIATEDLAFPMNQLREQKLVNKSGERAQAVYTLAVDAAARGRKSK